MVAVLAVAIPVPVGIAMAILGRIAVAIVILGGFAARSITLGRPIHGIRVSRRGLAEMRFGGTISVRQAMNCDENICRLYAREKHVTRDHINERL